MTNSAFSRSIMFPHVTVQPRPLGKVMFDFAFALILLTFLAIPFVFIAILIKVGSPGPVFFRQARIGLRNQVFRIWKFRTMRHSDADEWGAQLTLLNDPRITKIGGWLRKTSIDELPQLFNVITGQMSLVGPRPHPIEAKAGNTLYANAVRNYYLRHQVLPGITGWAQVNGWRGETKTVEQIEQRVLYDLDYIRRLSFWFDIKIIILTVARLRGKHVF